VFEPQAARASEATAETVQENVLMRVLP